MTERIDQKMIYQSITFPQDELDPGYLEWREALWEGAGQEVKEGWTRQVDVAAAAAFQAGRGTDAQVLRRAAAILFANPALSGVINPADLQVAAIRLDEILEVSHD